MVDNFFDGLCDVMMNDDDGCGDNSVLLLVRGQTEDDSLFPFLENIANPNVFISGPRESVM